MMSTTEGELDLEVPIDREDGELEDSDVEEGTYIPLERPETFNPPSLVHMQIQDEQSDEASPQESSASESDEEPHNRAKRAKIRPRRPQTQSQPDKKGKYNIWCKALEEDILTEDMVSCDVTRKTRYGVESYDYTIKYRLNDNYIPKKIFSSTDDYKDHDRMSNKRRHVDRSNKKWKMGKRVNSHHHYVKQQAIVLPDLTVTADDITDNIAKDIAEKLSEEKKDIIGRIVQVLGAQKAIEIYKETQEIEADGGMLIMNGTRRRTPGGIYFFLLKRDGDVSQEMINQIFDEAKKDQKKTARKVKRARAKSRQIVMEQLKQSLTDSELPSLLSRGEATVQSEHGSNPPPSPATDAREGSSDTDEPSPDAAPASPARPQSPLPDRTEPRRLQDYEEDDFLEVMCNDDMDMF